MTRVGGVYALSPDPMRRTSPVPLSNRYLPLDQYGQAHHQHVTLGDFAVTPKKPRRGKAVFAALLASLEAPAASDWRVVAACAPILPYVSAITAYTPASQAAARVRPMALSTSSLTFSSVVSGGEFSGEGTAASSFLPAPADGSPVPSDGYCFRSGDGSVKTM